MRGVNLVGRGSCVAVAVAAVLYGAQARAALTAVRLTVAPTPSGVVDTRYRDGDDGTVAIPLAWGTCPTITLTNGGACTTNLRTACNLVEAGTPDATLSLLSGTLPAGCSISGDGITGTVSGTSSSSVVVRATRLTATADTAAFTVQALAAGSDTTAPTVPLGLTGVDNADGTGTLTWEQSGDPTVSWVATGVASYQVKLAGSAVATVTAPAANVIPALTAYEVGSDTGEASSQSRANWSLTYSGGGLLATTDGIYGRWTLVTGDYTATAKITSYTPTSGTAGSVGIAARASNSAAGSIAIYSRWRDTDDKCNQRQRTTTDGTATNGTLSSAYTLPVWVKQTRSGDVFTTACSSDGLTWTTTSSKTVAPGAAVYVGPFITSGSAGNAATAAVDQFSIQQNGTVSYNYTGAGGSFTVNAYDGANRSSDSAAVTLAPTGGTPSDLISVPAATHTVCNSGCDFTPSQLQTIVSSAANASANGIAAGDSIELRATNAGGSESWSTRLVCNSVSGTSGSPIWVAVRAGDRITFDQSTPDGVGLIDLTSCNYWNFVGSRDGSSDGWKIADADRWWSPTCGGRNGAGIVYNCYPNRRATMLRSSDYIAFIGMTIHGAGTAGSSYNANFWDKNSDVILVKYTRFSTHGSQDTGPTSSPRTDSSDLFNAYANRIVIEDSEIDHGGHVNINFASNYGVIRRSKFNGDWSDIAPNADNYTGNHAYTSTPQSSRAEFNTVRFGPLVEDSTFYGTGTEPEHRRQNDAVQIGGVNPIFRGNYIATRAGVSQFGETTNANLFAICGTGTTEAVPTVRDAYHHIYHNTTWGGWVISTQGTVGSSTGQPADQCAGFKVKNNLFMGLEPTTRWNPQVVRWSAPSSLGSYTNPWKGAEWFGNVFGQHPTNPNQYMQFTTVAVGGQSGTLTKTEALDASTDLNGDYDCADASEGGNWPENTCGNLIQQLIWSASNTAAALANGANDPIPTDEDLRTKLVVKAGSSVALGDAWPLTTVDGVTSGTQISLASARYFKDEWDITYTWGGLHTEYGDCIAIGATAASAVTARITDINYTTGDITITPSRTITNGWKVWKATDNGDGTCGAVWDNRGAAQ